VDSILLTAGVILERAALAIGLLAAAMAVGGFIARAQALIREREPAELQRSMAYGGLLGICFGVLTVVVDMILG
jgi:hypothetical protein